MEVITAILTWFVIGLIVGVIARIIYPGAQPIGIIATSFLGIVGALVGGLVSWVFTGIRMPFSAYAWPGWIMAILGALLVLWIAVRAKSTQRHRR